VFFGIDKEYRDIYAESALVLTDYSSAALDFAYLKKPVIYAQFDREEFFSGAHVGTPGYFDFERDGLGEVTYDYDSTVDKLIEYIKSGCKMKDKYLDRRKRFFAFSDKNNSRRLLEKILETE
jgi:CDP-glycerol glycerophosphotransferase (TagB/SpsB family)